MISSGRHRPGILALIIAITTILRLSDIKTDKETKVRINFSGHCASLQGNLAPATTDLYRQSCVKQNFRFWSWVSVTRKESNWVQEVQDLGLTNAGPALDDEFLFRYRSNTAITKKTCERMQILLWLYLAENMEQSGGASLSGQLRNQHAGPRAARLSFSS